MLLFVANHSNPPATVLVTPIIFSKSNKSGTESAQRQPASHTLQTTKDSLMFCWGQYASFRSLQLPSSPQDTHCRISVTASGCIVNVWVGFARPVPAVPTIAETPSHKRTSNLYAEAVFRAFARCSSLRSSSGRSTAGGVFYAGLGSRAQVV